MNGAFVSGARLAEVPLAARLGVSRTPLRLALIALEQEGLVEEHPVRGYVVRLLQRSDVFDSIEVRGLLEGMAGRLIVERQRFSRLHELEGLVSMMDRALPLLDGDPRQAFDIYIDGNRKFHQLLLEMAESSTLMRQMERVTGLPFAAPSSGFLRVQIQLERSRHVLRMGQDQHHSILEAIEQKEATRAEMLLREHARLARKNLEIALEDNALRRKVPGLQLIRDRKADSLSGP